MVYSFLVVNNATEHRLYEEANIQSFLFVVAQQSLVDYSLLIVEVSRSHTRHTTLGRTWTQRLCLTTHKNCKRQLSMLPAGFEHAIPAIEQPLA